MCKEKRIVLIYFQRTVHHNHIQKAPSSKLRPLQVDPFILVTISLALVSNSSRDRLYLNKSTNSHKKASRLPHLWYRASSLRVSNSYQTTRSPNYRPTNCWSPMKARIPNKQGYEGQSYILSYWRGSITPKAKTLFLKHKGSQGPGQW